MIKNINYKYIFLFIVVVEVLDVISTILSLHNWNVEIIKVSKILIENWEIWFWMSIKIFMIPFTTYGIYKYTNNKSIIYIMWILHLILLYIALHNFYISI